MSGAARIPAEASGPRPGAQAWVLAVGTVVARPVTATVAALASAAETRLAAERGRLALWLPVALGAGVLAYFAPRTEPDPAWQWLPWPLIALALWLARRGARPHLAWGVGLLAAAALGFAAASWHAGRQPLPIAPPAGAVVLSGVVQSVALLPEGRRVTLAEARLGPGEPALARSVRVRLRASDPARPAPGDRITVRALLRPPAAPAYPGAWDFQRAAYFSGLGASGFALGPAAVTQGDGPAPPLAGLRATIEARTIAALPGAAGAIAAALLTGGQSAIPPAEMAAMRDSGLAHLLSVSGLHLTIVMGVAFAVARLLVAALPWLALRVSSKAWAAVAALAAGGFYTVLTGAEVPMQRSLAMAALVTLGVLVGRRALSPRALALAATAVLLVQPAQLLGPSFQMSFAAVLALIAGWERVRPLLAERRSSRGPARPGARLALWLAGGVATSLIAGAATTPFGLFHFGRLQLYGVAANALAVPITSVLVMPAGIAAVALMPFGLEWLALAPMGWGVEAILAVARAVAAWPGVAQAAAPMPAWGLAVTAFGMLWLCLWRTGWRVLGVPVIALGLGSAALVRAPDILVSGDARIIALRTEAAGVFVQRLPGGSGFTRETMLRGWAETEGAPFPREGEAAGGAVACTPVACTLRPRPDGAVAVLVREGAGGGADRREAIEAACYGRAAVVVAAEPLRARCRGAAAVDRFDVWRNGPHAVWLAGAGQAARVVSDRAWRGERPWVPPVPRPRARAGGSEPQARIDEAVPAPAAR